MSFRRFGEPFGRGGFGRPLGSGSGGSSAPLTPTDIAINYLLSLNPTLLVKFNEPSGNTINYGSDGGVGTPSNVAYGQAGQLAPNEAYGFNGTDSAVDFLNAALPATKLLTTQRWVFLVKANSLGEASTGRFLNWNDGAQNNNMLFRTTNRLQVTIDTDGTDAVVVTNFNQADPLLAGAYALVFMDFDDANTLGLGRRIRLMYATAAQPATLMTLATDTPATGTTQTHTGTLTLFNAATRAVTFDGLADLTVALPGLWSPTTPTPAPTDLSVPNAIRNLFFL